MRAAEIVILILALDALAFGLLFVWARRRSVEVAAALRQSATLQGESILKGPESGLYRGGTGGFGRVKGNGQIMLTDRRLVFQKLIGAEVVVRLCDVASVSQNKWFLGSMRNFQQNLTLTLADGRQVGFIVGDHDAWMEAVKNAVEAAKGKSHDTD